MPAFETIAELELKEQMKVLLDAPILELAREYCEISALKSLTEQDADRLAEIIRVAENNSCLEFWITEADHFLDHELGLATGRTLYPLETDNQKAALVEHFKAWEKICFDSENSDEAIQLIREMEEDITSGGSDLQSKLEEKGFFPGPIDGVVGPRTQAAIMRFQQSRNIHVSGEINERTQLELGFKT